jgi:hypothetical protein
MPSLAQDLLHRLAFRKLVDELCPGSEPSSSVQSSVLAFDHWPTEGGLAFSDAFRTSTLEHLALESIREVMLSGEAPDEEHDGCGIEKGSGGVDGSLEVLGEAPVAVDPCKEALDDPAPGEDDEASLTGDFADDFDGDAGGLPDAVMVIDAVGEELFDVSTKGKGFRFRSLAGLPGLDQRIGRGEWDSSIE